LGYESGANLTGAILGETKLTTQTQVDAEYNKIKSLTY